MYNRRELGRVTIAGLAAPFFAAFAGGNGDAGLGVQTGSFRGVRRTAGLDPIDMLAAAVGACGVRHCELSAPQIEAQYGGAHAGHHSMSAMSPQMMRRELRKWRLRVPDSYFQSVAARFTRAGVAISAYDYSPDASFTDEEIDRGFEMAKALGAQLITASTTMNIAKRVAPFADRHRMIVALYGAAPGGDPTELGTPGGFGAALSLSQYFRVGLDIGHGTAANFDALAYLRAHHHDVATLRLNDRRTNQGGNPSWGESDAPIREVLRLVKQESWPIRRYVGYDDAGAADPIDEVKKCVAYATQATM
jgi:hypothetical protein